MREDAGRGVRSGYWGEEEARRIFPATGTLYRIFVAMVENRKESFKGKNQLVVLMNTL